MNPTFLHISDLHFGGRRASRMGEAVLALADKLKPTAVLATGDLVDWAELEEPWVLLRKFLTAFRSPIISIPGNHDIVRFHPIDRLLSPLARYRRYVHPHIDRCLQLPGATIVGLGTPRRWTLDLGFLSDGQMNWAERCFAAAPSDNLRVVMVHHPIKRLPNTGIMRAHMRGSRRAQQRLLQMGADLVLSGHNHFPHLEELGTVPGRRLHWAQAGTACSRRVPRHAAGNSVTVFRCNPESVRVEWWYYSKARHAFGPGHIHTIERSQASDVASEVAMFGKVPALRA